MGNTCSKTTCVEGDRQELWEIIRHNYNQQIYKKCKARLPRTQQLLATPEGCLGANI
jgi:hypothetical protein